MGVSGSPRATPLHRAIRPVFGVFGRAAPEAQPCAPPFPVPASGNRFQTVQTAGLGPARYPPRDKFACPPLDPLQFWSVEESVPQYRCLAQTNKVFYIRRLARD